MSVLSSKFFLKSRRLLLCMVSSLVLLYGCEQQKKLTATDDTMPMTPTSNEPQQQDAPSAPDDAAPAVVDDSLSAQMKASEGKSCLVDKNCAGYLRCIEDVCTNPPAITGEHDEKTTPEVVFFDGEGEGAREVSRFFIEIADSAPERERGLMYRRSMLPNWGMLFIYPGDNLRSFWMKNTYIPLDMVFINSKGVVVGVVENAEPLTLDPRSVPTPARYVLELGAGVAKESGIDRGVHMDLLKPEDDAQRPLR